MGNHHMNLAQNTKYIGFSKLKQWITKVSYLTLVIYCCINFFCPEVS